MLKPALTLSLAFAVLPVLAGSANAGDRYGDRYEAPPPPAQTAGYYGPVNNYYAPVTIYAAPDSGSYGPAPAPAYPAYGPGYATPPQWDGNSYGAGYDWSHGYGNGGGTAYPAYGPGYGYGYPPANEGQRLDPWAGYNGGFGNGYW